MRKWVIWDFIEILIWLGIKSCYRIYFYVNIILENKANKCQPMRIIYTLTLVTYLESVKIFFSSEHSNGMLGDFYHAGNPSDVE